MKLYESWAFCKLIDCPALGVGDKEIRKMQSCEQCEVYRFHQYLRDHGQIFERDSELEQLVAENAELQRTLSAACDFVRETSQLPWPAWEREGVTWEKYFRRVAREEAGESDGKVPNA